MMASTIPKLDIFIEFILVSCFSYLDDSKCMIVWNKSKRNFYLLLMHILNNTVTFSLTTFVFTSFLKY